MLRDKPIWKAIFSLTIPSVPTILIKVIYNMADVKKIATRDSYGKALAELGAAVCGLLSEKPPTPVRRISVKDEFGHSGPANVLLKAFGLTSEHIVETAKDFLSKNVI